MMSRMRGRSDITRFKKNVWEYYRRHKRDLPWRRTHNPYRILVSEIMLQQTKVDRVISKYKEFLATFPNFHALDRASLRDVLKVWHGLGYNRRAIYLKKISNEIIKKYAGKLPSGPEILKKLPGIGPGTAGAISAFAFNKPSIFIETNIRRTFLHSFFPKKKAVSDTLLFPYIKAALDHRNPREWYYALMDYGAMLGRTVANPNKRSAHYKRQPAFRGSNRELRGKILHLFAIQRTQTVAGVSQKLGQSLKKTMTLLKTLQREGFLRKKGRRFMVY